MPQAKFLAVQPGDNRLVAGWVSGAVSRVQFSDAGNAEAWTATNYVDLTPGDGEVVRAVVAWREFVFVFKETKFFAFYGNQTDSMGSPVFNYRAVNTGVGCFTDGVAAAAEDGVYFFDRTGIYRTTGGEPQRVSAPLDPLFRRETVPFFQGSLPNFGGAFSFGVHRKRVFFGYSSSLVVDNTLVFDIPTGQWMPWNLPAAGFASLPGVDSTYGLFFSYASGTNHVGRITDDGQSAATTDNAAAITSRYRTGFYDLGVQGEKRTRQMTVWGAGTTSLKLSRDYGALDTARPLVLGTVSAPDRATANCAKDGALFSHEFSGTGAWWVHRAAMEFMPRRPPGSKTP